MSSYDPKNAPPRPPQKLWSIDLCDILTWYENNLCSECLADPRGKEIFFSPERLPHLIHLLNPVSKKEVKGAQKEVEAIREGRKTNADYGGYDPERAQTLSWLPILIREPTQILQVAEQTLWEKPGDTILVKEFDKHGYRQKILVCRTVGANRLTVVTSYPRDHRKRFNKAYQKVWP